MDKEKAKQLLFDIIDTLEKYQIKYCLFFGTLLGAIRDKDFIENDYDIDIGIFNRFWDDNKLLQKIGWDLLSKNIKISNLAANHVMHISREIGVDLYYQKEVNDFYICEGAGWKTKIPNHYFEKLISINFLGKKCYIPNKVENFLDEVYANKWKEKLTKKETKYGIIKPIGKKIGTIKFINFLYIYENNITNG